MTEPTTEAKAQAYDRVMEVLNRPLGAAVIGNREVWIELREVARIQPTGSERLERAVAIANERLGELTRPNDYWFQQIDDLAWLKYNLKVEQLERLLGIDQ